MQIRNDDGMEVLRFKLRDHSGKVRETFAIYSEGTVLFLVVDSQINNVGGDIIRTQTGCDFDHSRLRGETGPQVGQPASPNSTQRHAARQPHASSSTHVRA